MRCIKMFGLAVLSAMALMAVVASSVSAARVCSTSGTGAACNAGHGKIYTGTTSLKNSGNVVFTMTNPDNTTGTCTGSSLTGTVTNGATGTGTITGLSFTGCSSGFCFGAVAVTSTASASSPWSGTVSTTIEAVENTNGIMTIAAGAFKFTCSFPSVECVYSFSNLKLHADGSDVAGAAKLTVTNVTAVTTSGPEFTCGTDVDWSGTYIFSTPSTLMIE